MGDKVYVYVVIEYDPSGDSEVCSVHTTEDKARERIKKLVIEAEDYELGYSYKVERFQLL